MPDVHLLTTTEEDDVRTYSVDELVDGASGIVVASSTPSGGWSYDFQGPERFASGERSQCIEAVRDFVAAQI